MEVLIVFEQFFIVIGMSGEFKRTLVHVVMGLSYPVISVS